MYLSYNLEYFHFILFINTLLKGKFSLIHEQGDDVVQGNCAFLICNRIHSSYFSK